MATTKALELAQFGTSISIDETTGKSTYVADHLLATGNKAFFGDNEDLAIYSTGSDSIIQEAGSGALLVRGSNLSLQDSANANYLQAVSGGAVTLYHNAVAKFATTTTGVAVTGTLTADTFTGVALGGSLTGTADDAKVLYSVTAPSTPSQGYFYFDSLNQKMKVYTGSAWVDAVPSSVGGGASASDALATFRKYTYSVTATTNAVSGIEDDIVTTGSFIVGRLYEITTVGDTDFTLIGATANTVGEQFTATDVGDGTTGQAAEVLNYIIDGSQNIEVYVNGVKQVEGASNDYVATTGSSVTFTSNLSSGDVVDVQVYELLTTSSFYLQSEVNAQISTAVSNYLPLTGGNLTGDLDIAVAAYGNLLTAAGTNGYLSVSNPSENLVTAFTGTNDVLALGTSSTEKMRIDGAGNVGIGSTSPTKKLTVFGTGAGNATVQIEGEDGADPYINFLTNNTQHWSLGVDDSDSDKFKLSEHSALGTNDYLTVDVTGNVGIGTIFPKTNLDLSSITGPQITLTRSQTSNNAGDTLGRLNFYNSDLSGDGANNAAIIEAIASSGTGAHADLLFRTKSTGTDGSDAAEAMRLDSSGNLLVGTTEGVIWNQAATDTSKQGVVIEPRSIQISRFQDTPLLINRQGNDGTLQVFAKDGTTVGKIGVDYGTEFYMGGGGAGFYLNTGSIRPTTGGDAGTLSDNTHDLGSLASRFKDLYLSGGVVFDAAGGTGTNTSNKLDDYEEGTFTPFFSKSGGTTDFATSYSFVTGRYTKVGNLVTYIIDMSGTGIDATAGGFISISGLPFTSSNNHSYPAATSRNTSAITCDSTKEPRFWVNSGTTYIYIQFDTPNTGASDTSTSQWDNSGRVNITGHYFTN